MEKEIKLYKCKICGNIVLMLEKGGGVLNCCNEEMKLLTANTSDGALEKHVPILKEKIKECKIADSNIYTVQVGNIEHPMLKEHYIQWIGSFDNEAWVIKWLQPSQKPQKNLRISKKAQVLEYCNVHGLFSK